MATNPLRQSIKTAISAFAELDRLFAMMGNSLHPRGAVTTAYRNAQRGLRSSIFERDPFGATKEVTDQLITKVAASFSYIFDTSQAKGRKNAEKQLNHYGVGLPDPAELSRRYQQKTIASMKYTKSLTQAQINNIEGLILTEGDPLLILGTKERLGALRPGDVLAAGAFYIAMLFWDAWDNTVLYSDAGSGSAFSKQVIAALDPRTTDCCLRAHGQIQPLNNNFTLTGTPRYADELPWPPFHRWCRSSVALYQPGFDDGITARMTSSADRLLADREAGTPAYKRYSDAFY